MISPKDMQFYINSMVDMQELIDTLSALLGMELETLEMPNDQASGFITIFEYKQGFPMGVHILWKGTISSKSNYLEVAKSLAIKFKALVATDLPPGDPLFENPYVWCVAAPDGKLSKYRERLDDSDEEGLFLDYTSGEVI